MVQVWRYDVDEIHEVIPITEEYGIWHPQEGISVKWSLSTKRTR